MPRRHPLRPDAGRGPARDRDIGTATSFRLAVLIVGLVSVSGLAASVLRGQDRRSSHEWTYDPEGRRDPFVNLLTVGGNPTPVRERPRGLAGLRIDELTLRGLVALGRENLAVFESPDRKTYILRGGERLFDGSVKSVTRDGVVFLAEVSDPLALASTREVRRTLRQEAGP